MFHCTPHPGLGTVVVRHVQVDLATCKHPSGLVVVLHETQPTVRARHGSQSIVFKGKVVLTIHERYGKDTPQGIPGPVELFGTSPDRKWVLYAIDPQGSASLAADGLQLMAVPVGGGPSKAVAFGLLSDDYRAWCGGKLFMTAGGDRIAIHNKRLIVTGPPGWHAHVLVRAPDRAFGALACAPDGVSVDVQSEKAGGVNDSEQAYWSLWRVGPGGATARLTSPPPGYSDDTPRVAGDVVYFVRSRRNVGKLYALRSGGRLLGPLLNMGAAPDSYYGHREWPYTVTR